MAWAKNGTPDTLSGTAGSVDISDLTAKTFNMFMCHMPTSASPAALVLTLAGVTNTDYAERGSQNGASDGTTTSATSIQTHYATDTSDEFVIIYCFNVSGEEKLLIGYDVERKLAGETSSPNRREFVGKMDTTTDSGQFTQITLSDTSGTDLPTDTNLSALGTD